MRRVELGLEDCVHVYSLPERGMFAAYYISSVLEDGMILRCASADCFEYNGLHSAEFERFLDFVRDSGKDSVHFDDDVLGLRDRFLDCRHRTPKYRHVRA